jgi:hypothetical protein
MFLLRAAFWLAAVVVLMPREPDLGLPGEPQESLCVEDTCIDATQWLNEFRAAALSSLARVRADLEARERG